MFGPLEAPCCPIGSVPPPYRPCVDCSAWELDRVTTGSRRTEKPSVSCIPEIYQRHLRLLGIDGLPTGIKGLEEITLRHLCTAPFENISKLLLFDREGTGRAVSHDEFLDGIEFRDLGGTCHSSNPFLAELLQALGYDAILLGANMSGTDVHTTIRVCVDSVEYHVDMGYAAPFRKPIRLDRLPHEVVQGDFTYVLDRRASDGRYEVTVRSGEKRIHGYVVNEAPRDLEYFHGTIRESYEPGRDFMTRLRITRFFEDHAIELSNLTAIYFKGRESRKTELRGVTELERTVFGDMQMPLCPVRKAVEILERVTGQPISKLGNQTSQ